MKTENLALFPIKVYVGRVETIHGRIDRIHVLSDGKNCRMVSKENYSNWVNEIDRRWAPVFDTEISEHMRKQWEFAFDLSENLSLSELKRATMSKPISPLPYFVDEWNGITCQRSVQCHECDAIYPLFGRTVQDKTEICEVCGYKYDTNCSLIY